MFGTFLFLVIFVFFMLLADAERKYQVQADAGISLIAVSNVQEINMAFFTDFISDEIVIKKAHEEEKVVTAETPITEPSSINITVHEALDQQIISSDALLKTNSEEIKPAKKTRKPRTKKETSSDGVNSTASKKARTHHSAA